MGNNIVPPTEATRLQRQAEKEQVAENHLRNVCRYHRADSYIIVLYIKLYARSHSIDMV